MVQEVMLVTTYWKAFMAGIMQRKFHFAGHSICTNVAHSRTGHHLLNSMLYDQNGLLSKIQIRFQKRFVPIVQRLEKNRPKIFRILESFEFTFII